MNEENEPIVTLDGEALHRILIESGEATIRNGCDWIEMMSGMADMVVASLNIGAPPEDEATKAVKRTRITANKAVVRKTVEMFANEFADRINARVGATKGEEPEAPPTPSNVADIRKNSWERLHKLLNGSNTKEQSPSST